MTIPNDAVIADLNRIAGPPAKKLEIDWLASYCGRGQLSTDSAMLLQEVAPWSLQPLT
jgi:hypothetical protein